MVRVYQARIPVPLAGSVGETIEFRIERKGFRGEIKQIDPAEVVIALEATYLLT